MKTEDELRAGHLAATRIMQTARGALRLLRPHAIDRDVAAHVDGLAVGSEAIERLLKVRGERQRMTREIHGETLTARRRGAGIALHRLQAVREYIGEWRDWVSRTRRDVASSFEQALTGVDRNGLILLGLAREQLRARLTNAPVRELLSTYEAAQTRRHDPIAYLESEIIEQLVERGGVHAASEADLPTFKQLRELINELQEMRMPVSLPDFEDLAADLDRLSARAHAAEVSPINPDHDHEASAYYKSQEAELLTVGTRSDREDIEAVRQEQSLGAGGE